MWGWLGVAAEAAYESLMQRLGIQRGAVSKDSSGLLGLLLQKRFAIR
jgi:hypothetical protein